MEGKKKKVEVRKMGANGDELGEAQRRMRNELGRHEEDNRGMDGKVE